MDPQPFSLRVLVEMYRGFGQDAWSHTSATLALMANCNRDPKKPPYTPDDFTPSIFRDRRGGGSRGEPLTTDTLDVIRESIKNRKNR